MGKVEKQNKTNEREREKREREKDREGGRKKERSKIVFITST